MKNPLQNFLNSVVNRVPNDTESRIWSSYKQGIHSFNIIWNIEIERFRELLMQLVIYVFSYELHITPLFRSSKKLMAKYFDINIICAGKDEKLKSMWCARH